MHVKLQLAWMAVVVALLIVLGSGCASSLSGKPSSPVEKPSEMTDHMKRMVGTPDELSPLAPAEARKVRKVGNQWTCEINGQPMVYNEAATRWEPQGK
jgi:hypothetical protein